MTNALAISSTQDDWTPEQAAALQTLGVEQPTQPELAMFLHYCQRTGLDPFARQIHMVRRDGRQVIQTGIDGLRLIARRAADQQGEGIGYDTTQWCGPDGQWRDVWLEKGPPAAAKVVVRRNGHPFDAVALFDAYAGRKRDGNLNRMWQQQGAHMIAKCAEALALRKAFPQDLSGLYTTDEIQQSSGAEQPAQPAQQVQAPSAAAPAGKGMADDEVQAWMEEIAAAETREELKALWEHLKGGPEQLATALNRRAAEIQQQAAQTVTVESTATQQEGQQA